MVKGISRQVIVVRPPDEKLFEQAIFILKDPQGAVSSEELLRQAQQAADTYLRTRTKGGRARGVRWKPVAYAALGALSASVLWLVSVLLL